MKGCYVRVVTRVLIRADWK